PLPPLPGAEAGLRRPGRLSHAGPRAGVQGGWSVRRDAGGRVAPARFAPVMAGSDRDVYPRRMARSMWRGAISFGMVAIPVRMYLATESRSVSFRMLCPRDHTPIKQKRWCPEEDREVGWTETVRGFEVAK